MSGEISVFILSRSITHDQKRPLRVPFLLFEELSVYLDTKCAKIRKGVREAFKENRLGKMELKDRYCERVTKRVRGVERKHVPAVCPRERMTQLHEEGLNLGSLFSKFDSHRIDDCYQDYVATEDLQR